MTLTQEKLKEILHYNPETGIFTWRVGRRGAKKGAIAGYKQPNGYIITTVYRKRCLMHRLAFFYMEGFFPENEVDHINRIKDDNRWVNLRHVSHQCNLRNISIRKNNTSGATGIYFDKHNNKFMARIMVNRKTIHLGRFKNFDDAVMARYKKEQELNWGSCDDNSTAYQYLKKHGLLNGKHTQLTIFDFIEKQK